MAHQAAPSAPRGLEEALTTAKGCEPVTSNNVLGQIRVGIVIQTLRRRMHPPRDAPAHHRAEVAEEARPDDVFLVQEVLPLQVQRSLPIHQCQGPVTETAPPCPISRKSSLTSSPCPLLRLVRIKAKARCNLSLTRSQLISLQPKPNRQFNPRPLSRLLRMRRPLSLILPPQHLHSSLLSCQARSHRVIAKHILWALRPLETRVEAGDTVQASMRLIWIL